MNKNRKYCLLFLLFMLLLIAGTGTLYAANNTETTEITDNTIQKVETAPEKIVSNDEKEKIEIIKEDEKNPVNNNETINTPSTKEITKINYTKTNIEEFEPVFEPASGKVGDKIRVKLPTYEGDIIRVNIDFNGEGTIVRIDFDGRRARVYSDFDGEISDVVIRFDEEEALYSYDADYIYFTVPEMPGGKYHVYINVNTRIGGDVTNYYGWGYFDVIQPKISTKFVIETFNEEITVKDNLLITGKLLTEENKPITDTIDVHVNAKSIGTVRTDNAGYFEYFYPVTQPKDNLLFAIFYYGNDVYEEPYYYSNMFNVVALPITVSLDEVNNSKVNETVTISGTVLDENNNTVNNLPLNLSITGVSDKINVNTDDMGKFTHTMAFNEAGEVTVTVSNDNPLYNTTPVSTTFNVEGSEKLVIQPFELNLTSVTTVTVTLNNFDETENECFIVFKLNGKTLRDETGNVIYARVVDGVATFEYNFTIQELKNGAELVSVYLGSENYEPDMSAPYTVTAEELTASIVLDDVSAVVGETITLTANVTCDDAPVNDGRVVFKLNGKSLKGTDGKILYADVKDGIATVQYPLLKKYKLGDYQITAVLSSISYKRAETEATLTINK